MSGQKTKTNAQSNPNPFAAFGKEFDATGSVEELTSIGRSNFEAFVKASQIATQGYGACAQTALDFARSALERNAETAQAVLASKNVQDATEVQSTWARGAFDTYVSQAGKLTEMTTKVTSEAFAPIQARIDETVTKTAKAAA